MVNLNVVNGTASPIICLVSVGCSVDGYEWIDADPSVKPGSECGFASDTSGFQDGHGGNADWVHESFGLPSILLARQLAVIAFGQWRHCNFSSSPFDHCDNQRGEKSDGNNDRSDRTVSFADVFCFHDFVSFGFGRISVFPSPSKFGTGDFLR